MLVEKLFEVVRQSRCTFDPNADVATIQCDPKLTYTTVLELREKLPKDTVVDVSSGDKYNTITFPNIRYSDYDGDDYVLTDDGDVNFSSSAIEANMLG
jgi:hypothetical protein